MGRMTRTVNGSVASFKSPGAVPIRSLKAYFTPIQNGSGDPNPENVRPISGWNGLDISKCSTNLYFGEFEEGSINVNTGQNYNSDGMSRLKEYFPVIGGKKYSVVSNDNYKRVYWYDKDKEYISGNTGSSSEKIAPSNACYAKVVVVDETTPNPEETYSFNYPSTDTSYHQYSGEIIPIEFPASGKNLLDPTERNDQFGNNIFYYRENHTSLKAGTYTISTSASGVSIYVYQYVDGQQTTLFVNYRVSSMTFTLENDTDNIGFNFYIGTGIDHTATCQLERGSSATTYEPYTTTVYGGYVNLITGELVQEQIGRTFKGSDADQVTELTNTKKFRFRFYKALKGNGVTKAGITYCDKLQYQYHEDDKLHYYFTDNNSNGNAYAYLPKDFSDNDEVTIIASLYTPEIVATLSPTELRTLIGQNNIWCNADNVEVTYDLAESTDIAKRKHLFFNEPHDASAFGDIVSFETDMVGKLKYATFGFKPIQNGSRDPSPENVRPINGYNAIDINFSGKNLFDIDTFADGADLSVSSKRGTLTYNASNKSFVCVSSITGNYTIECHVKPVNHVMTFANDTTLRMSYKVTNGKPNSGNYLRSILYFSNGTNTAGNSSYADGYYKRTVTIPANTYITDFVLFASYTGNVVEGETIIFSEIQFELANTETSYEPYKGETIPIEFPVIGDNLFSYLNADAINMSNTNGVFTNTNVDTRQTLEIYCRGLDVSGVMIGNFFTRYQAPLGVYETTFTVSDAYANMTTFQIKHNGSTRDFIINIPMRLEVGKIYKASFNVLANDPTTVGGVSITDIQLYNVDDIAYGGYIDAITGDIYATHQFVTLGYTVTPVINNRSESPSSTAGGGYANSSVTGNDGSKQIYLEIGWTNSRPQYNKYLCNYNNKSTAISDSAVINTSIDSISSCKELKLNEFCIYTDTASDYEGNPLCYFRVALPSTCTTFQLKREYLRDHPMQFAYPLKHPYKIGNVNSVNLKTFKGVNNFWSSGNGETGIVYWTHK